MNIINYLKGLIYRLFPARNIKDALNIDIAISQEMINAIDNWCRMYSGNAYWVKKDVKSLHLEQSITREFADIVFNEMIVNVTNDKLNNIFNSAIRDINMNFRKGLATGAMVIKPLGADKVQYVTQDGFIPIEYDTNGRLIKVIFPDIKQVAENSFYTRLEFHSLDYENGLTIENKAFHSNSKSELGREVPLSSVDEWANLEPKVTYPKMLRPAFGYYRNPINNEIDGSKAGVSIFESAVEMIKKADTQFGRLDWEFESGERKLFLSEMALKKDDNDNLAASNDRLFAKLASEDDDFYKEFSPQLRQNDFISGLDEYKREIEFQVGLAYGDISNPQAVDKTATEVKSAKARKYNTVTAIQKNLKDCLNDLVYALAFFNSMATTNYEFVCDFKDSILTDEETERKQDKEDVAMGVMQLWEYRMKWYGETEEQAKKMVANTNTEVIN